MRKDTLAHMIKYRPQTYKTLLRGIMQTKSGANECTEKRKLVKKMNDLARSGIIFFSKIDHQEKIYFHPYKKYYILIVNDRDKQSCLYAMYEDVRVLDDYQLKLDKFHMLNVDRWVPMKDYLVCTDEVIKWL